MHKFPVILCILSGALLLNTNKVVGQSCTKIQTGKSNVNVRLSGQQILVMNNTSLHDCVRECLSLAHCKSFNYGQVNSVCELNDADSTDASVDLFQAANRYIYSDIAAWPKVRKVLI